MKYYGRLFLFGFASWLLIFLTSLAFFPLRETHRPLFETLMGICLTVGTLALTIEYFANVRRSHMPEGLRLGLAFFVVNVVLDLSVFMWGPMKTPLSEYILDVGLACLSMPLITLGFAYALRRSRHARRSEAEGSADYIKKESFTRSKPSNARGDKHSLPLMRDCEN